MPPLADHLLPRMLELGLLATVNSDDPAYFGGGIYANLDVLMMPLWTTDADLAVLAANSFEAAFVDEADRVVLAGGGGRRAHVSQAVATSRASSWAFSALSASSTACAFSPDGQRAKAVRAAPSAM